MTQIAVVQYEIEALPAWQAYEDKIVRMVESAKENGAEIILLSEYAGLELASWTHGNLKTQLNVINELLPNYRELFLSLAKEYQLYIQPGTIPVKEDNQFYRNRAYLFSPKGQMGFQDKIYLTPFEKETRVFQSGTCLNIFKTDIGCLGIITSYDSEFPTLANALTKKGAQLLLVPSCTEGLTGLTRVSISSRARAIENQCYVAQSCLIGKASWCELIDITIGQSAIYSPVDIGFPENGIVAQAEINTPMMISATLDFDKINYARQHGEMHHFEDIKKNIFPELVIEQIALTS